MRANLLLREAVLPHADFANQAVEVVAARGVAELEARKRVAHLEALARRGAETLRGSSLGNQLAVQIVAVGNLLALTGLRTVARNRNRVPRAGRDGLALRGERQVALAVADVAVTLLARDADFAAAEGLVVVARILAAPRADVVRAAVPAVAEDAHLEGVGIALDGHHLVVGYREGAVHGARVVLHREARGVNQLAVNIQCDVVGHVAAVDPVDNRLVDDGRDGEQVGRTLLQPVERTGELDRQGVGLRLAGGDDEVVVGNPVDVLRHEDIRSAVLGVVGVDQSGVDLDVAHGGDGGRLVERQREGVAVVARQHLVAGDGHGGLAPCLGQRDVGPYGRRLIVRAGDRRQSEYSGGAERQKILYVLFHGLCRVGGYSTHLL